MYAGQHRGEILDEIDIIYTNYRNVPGDFNAPVLDGAMSSYLRDIISIEDSSDLRLLFQQLQHTVVAPFG